jgi:hypothetical protein
LILKKNFLKGEAIISIIVVLIAIIYLKFFSKNIGDVIDEYNGVKVYYNGINFAQSYGSNYGADSFYYGKKWQCVEFVKRYYHDYLHHTMPDGMGNAKDFFDKKLASGQLNKRRNLIQYTNGSNIKPSLNDILVFDGSYGHVCIISAAGENEIEVVQQNIFGKSRQTFQMKFENNSYLIGSSKKPLGWLHKP